jgi:hypothetical protein
MTSFQPKLATSFALALCVLGAGSSHAADLGGHWYVESTFTAPASPFFEWSQAGDTFTVPAEVFFGGMPGTTCPGLITGNTLTNADSSCSLAFEAKVLAGDTIVDGSLTAHVFVHYTPSRFLAHRCECFDGNQDDGDGCDASCRVETCHTCSGDPSVCTPTANGAACNDRTDCTAGETCAFGTCGGGTSVPGCIDLTGRWQILTVQDELTQSTYDLRDVEQRDGVLRMTRPSNGDLAEVGTIVPSTGAMDLVDGRADGWRDWNHKPGSLNAVLPSCGPVSISAMAAAGGASFSGAGLKSVLGSFRVATSGLFAGECTEERDFEWTATKCADGACQVLPDSCPPCERPDGEGGCEIGPREGCLTSAAPRRSSLMLIGSGRFRWKWKSGMSFDPRLLGDPASYTGTQICMFDESSETPQLVFSTYRLQVWSFVPDFEEYDWTQKGNEPRFQRMTYAGKESISWEASDSDRSSFVVQGRGGSGDPSFFSGGLADGFDFEETYFLDYSIVPFALPQAPLNPPIRMQARMDFGGACFESVFGADGVRKNADGKFTAKSTQ